MFINNLKDFWMQNYHLTKKGEEWRLEKEKSDEALVCCSTKKEAIEKMREYMSGRVGSVKIHKENGQFEEERTYPRSMDPRSSKG